MHASDYWIILAFKKNISFRIILFLNCYFSVIFFSEAPSSAARPRTLPPPYDQGKNTAENFLSQGCTVCSKVLHSLFPDQAVFLIVVTGTGTNVVDPNTLNLDPDPGFWSNFDPDPGLYYQLLRKKFKIILEKIFFSLKQVPVPVYFYRNF